MIKKKSGQSRAIIFQYSNEASARDMRGDVVVEQIGETHAVQYRVDREIDVVDDESPLHSCMDRLAVFSEVPSEDRSIGKAIANAVVSLQIPRCSRNRMSRQVFG